MKRRHNVKKTAFLMEQVSALIQHKTLPKYKDPGCPTISCIIGDHDIEEALLDLGASVNLMPYSIYLQLGVLKSLPQRFHAKITAIEESKDIDKIPLTELVGNLLTYELGLTRIGKSRKSKSMTLKAKSSDIDETLDNEDPKMKSYITR